jgi:hypothetical protein
MGLTASRSPVCTRVCTSEGENANAGRADGGPGDGGQRADTDQAGRGEGIDHGEAGPGSSTTDQGDPLAKLAAALVALSPDDRAAIVAMVRAADQGGEVQEPTA